MGMCRAWIAACIGRPVSLHSWWDPYPTVHGHLQCDVSVVQTQLMS